MKTVTRPESRQATARVLALRGQSSYLINRANFVATHIQEVLRMTHAKRSVAIPVWKGRWSDYNDQLAPGEDLYGGLSSHLGYFDKTIIHPLVPDARVRPSFWMPDIASMVGDAALPGYACFSRDDIVAAGLHLFERGIAAVRIKPATSDAGLGQRVVTSEAELRKCSLALTDFEVVAGVSVEEHIPEVIRTLSVGTSLIGEFEIAYIGVQGTTVFRGDSHRWGSSELYVRRGSLEDLEGWVTVPSLLRAVRAARSLDKALRFIRGTHVTRRNYDVLHGIDSRGVTRVALLEQSWRIGGASPAETLAAAQLIGRGAALVKATVTERFDDEVATVDMSSPGTFIAGELSWDGTPAQALIHVTGSPVVAAKVPFLNA